jgi:hypothetical protein
VEVVITLLQHGTDVHAITARGDILQAPAAGGGGRPPSPQPRTRRMDKNGQLARTAVQLAELSTHARRQEAIAALTVPQP